MAAGSHDSRALSHKKWVCSVRFAANDAHLSLRFYDPNRILVAQEVDERGRIGRGVDAADLERLQLRVIDGQRPAVVPIELLGNLTQRHVLKYQALLHPRRS